MTRSAGKRAQSLSAIEARRIALRAQGFGRPPAAQPGRPQVLAAVRQLGLLQLDSVNVLIRSHYLPLFSRLGAYDREHLDRMASVSPRTLVEYWGHEASLLPVETWPRLRWRMDEAREGRGIWKGIAAFARERSAFVRRIRDEVRDRGPIAAGELSVGTKPSGAWWGWSEAKRALEYLFWVGDLTSAGRRGFQRLYDLPERVLPPRILGQAPPTRAEAQADLLRHAARASGVATEADLRDYFRLPVTDTRARLAELVEAGELQQVTVEGWKQPGFLVRASPGGAVEASALLSPFDSLIWCRPRTERLFGFHYRLAFYTPRAERSHGYYVMPFLMGHSLVARVDLKADRAEGALRVEAGHAEPGKDEAEVAAALVPHLATLASWLGLREVRVTARTRLALALRRADRATGSLSIARK
jgi:uncharacterized protein YcaQ